MLLIKRILQYLKDTANLGLLYFRKKIFEAFSNADYVGDLETSKLTLVQFINTQTLLSCGGVSVKTAYHSL